MKTFNVVAKSWSTENADFPNASSIAYVCYYVTNFAKDSTISSLKTSSIAISRQHYIEQTGLYALEEVVLSLEKRNIAVVITGLQNQPHRMLQRINLVPSLIPENYLFDKIEDCIQWLGEELTQSKGDE